MKARELEILTYFGNTPTLARCQRCDLKFFTLTKMHKDPLGSAKYLEDKFHAHSCVVRMPLPVIFPYAGKQK